MFQAPSHMFLENMLSSENQLHPSFSPHRGFSDKQRGSRAWRQEVWVLAKLCRQRAVCLGRILHFSGSRLHFPEKEDVGLDDDTTVIRHGVCGVLLHARHPPLCCLAIMKWFCCLLHLQRRTYSLRRLAQVTLPGRGRAWISPTIISKLNFELMSFPYLSPHTALSLLNSYKSMHFITYLSVECFHPFLHPSLLWFLYQTFIRHLLYTEPTLGTYIPLFVHYKWWGPWL